MLDLVCGPQDAYAWARLRRVRSSASPTGWVRLVLKAHMIDMLNRAGTRDLSLATAALADQIGDPIVVILNDGGAAVFIPGEAPRRIVMRTASCEERLRRVAASLQDKRIDETDLMDRLQRAFTL